MRENKNITENKMGKIEDSLQDCCDNASDEIVDRFISYLEENTDVEDFDTIYQHELADAMHEIADSNTPIYYSEIDGLYYLYSSELEESYQNHGFGDGTEDNHKQVTIYCYIMDAISETIQDLRDKFEEFTDEHDTSMDTWEEDLKEFLKEVKEEVLER